MPTRKTINSANNDTHSDINTFWGNFSRIFLIQLKTIHTEVPNFSYSKSFFEKKETEKTILKKLDLEHISFCFVFNN